MTDAMPHYWAEGRANGHDLPRDPQKCQRPVGGLHHVYACAHCGVELALSYGENCDPGSEDAYLEIVDNRLLDRCPGAEPPDLVME